ncbi:MAG: DUF1643 domain-containing protein [Planctomycetota bacterium]
MSTTELQARGATISDCARYRYSLWRRWADGPSLVFIGLNPSTADADLDDPTIRRCVGFAKRDGYGGLHMLNLYAFRSTDPKRVVEAEDAVGPDNDAALREGTDAADVVASWGAIHWSTIRATRVLSMIDPKNLWCLGRTKHGHPRHPLYVKADRPLEPFGVSALRRS